MVIHPPLSLLNKQQSRQPASKQSTAAATTGPHRKCARLDAVDHHGKESMAAQQSGSCAPRATSHFAQHKQQCTPTLHHESLTTHAPCRRGRTQAMPKHTPPCCKLCLSFCGSSLNEQSVAIVAWKWGFEHRAAFHVHSTPLTLLCPWSSSPCPAWLDR